MITKRIKELENAKARLARLEKSLAAQLQEELASLPAAYGFGSIRAFVAAVSQAGSRRGRGRAAGRKAKAAPTRSRRRRRAVITDATRANVKKLVQGGKTGAEIAKAVGISLPSVQNIKKSLGLVKSRS
jgi:hypothetical protein